MMKLKELLELIKNADPESEIYLGHTGYLVDNYNLSQVLIYKNMIDLRSNKYEIEPNVSEYTIENPNQQDLY